MYWNLFGKVVYCPYIRKYQQVEPNDFFPHIYQNIKVVFVQIYDFDPFPVTQNAKYKNAKKNKLNHGFHLQFYNWPSKFPTSHAEKHCLRPSYSSFLSKYFVPPSYMPKISICQYANWKFYANLKMLQFSSKHFR